MIESKSGGNKPGESGSDRLFSDGFLGALVVLLTIAIAFAAYEGALTGIEGDDLDVAAQRAMLLATSSYLSGNTEFLEDLQIYDLTAFIFAIGLAAIAWAALVGCGRRIKFVFLLMALALEVPIL